MFRDSIEVCGRRAYPTDLTDAEWEVVEPFLPPPRRLGRQREVSQREIINAIRYLQRSGCAWRLLPHDFPKWETVYWWLRRWMADGTWQRMHDQLREDLRAAAGRHDTPSAAIVDSQSVKTTEKGGRAVTTPARKSRAASGMSWSTPSA
jgi:transposase